MKQPTLLSLYLLPLFVCTEFVRSPSLLLLLSHLGCCWSRCRVIERGRILFFFGAFCSLSSFLFCVSSSLFCHQGAFTAGRGLQVAVIWKVEAKAFSVVAIWRHPEWLNFWLVGSRDRHLGCASVVCCCGLLSHLSVLLHNALAFINCVDREESLPRRLGSATLAGPDLWLRGNFLNCVLACPAIEP